jgi:hypothetical protein
LRSWKLQSEDVGRTEMSREDCIVTPAVQGDLKHCSPFSRRSASINSVYEETPRFFWLIRNEWK